MFYTHTIQILDLDNEIEYVLHICSDYDGIGGGVGMKRGKIK
jgi:hypothetical protein